VSGDAEDREAANDLAGDIGRTAPPRDSSNPILPARVPPGMLWSFRAIFTLVIAAYVVIAYIAVRSMQGHFGASVVFVLWAIVPVIVLGVFTLPLVPLAELPENWMLQQLPASRRRRGLCPACGYPMARTSRESDARGAMRICPECGSDGRVRPLVEPSWSALGRFLQMAVIAYLLGIVIGESLIQMDERRFRNEVSTLRASSAAPAPGPPPDRAPSTVSSEATAAASALRGKAVHWRPRQWPGSFATMRWTEERGFESEAPGLAAKPR